MAQIPDLQSYNLIYRWDKWQARDYQFRFFPFAKK